MSSVSHLIKRILPGRKIEGICALLLPHKPDGTPDLDAFARLIGFARQNDLCPAVNMDTGYVHLLSPQERIEVLKVTQSMMKGRPFVAGAFIEGQDQNIVAAYAQHVQIIRSYGGTPILFQCSGLKGKSPAVIADTYRKVAAECDSLLVFELGEMFASFGEIYSLETVERIMEIPQVRGLKHSSLNRQLEWERLELRDRIRPDFKIYTGNDLAIDMIIYGSDYLLGLATFAADAFARRDHYWTTGDSRFFGLNDLLQYLGFFAFREPVPAYRHTAAQFLKIRGIIPSDQPHPQSPRRPSADVEVLKEIARRLDRLLSA